jgi:molecular chaperone DnaK (HSP70)
MDKLCQSLHLLKMDLTLEEYNKACQPLFDRSISPVTRLLKDLSLRPSEMDEIVMVGGTTRMPQIRELVRQAFSNAQLNTHIDPDITVAYGAASVID